MNADTIPNAIVAGPKLPGYTLKEAIAYIKERPGQFNYQAPLGSYSHLDMLSSHIAVLGASRENRKSLDAFQDDRAKAKS